MIAYALESEKLAYEDIEIVMNVRITYVRAFFTGRDKLSETGHTQRKS